MSAVTYLSYDGPPSLLHTLAQMLEDEGVSTEYDQPAGARDLTMALAVSAVVLAATGNVSDILTAVEQFRQRFGHRAVVGGVPEIEASLTVRLAQVDALFEQGKISKEEQKAQRSRILDEL